MRSKTWSVLVCALVALHTMRMGILAYGPTAGIPVGLFGAAINTKISKDR